MTDWNEERERAERHRRENDPFFRALSELPEEMSDTELTLFILNTLSVYGNEGEDAVDLLIFAAANAQNVKAQIATKKAISQFTN